LDKVGELTPLSLYLVDEETSTVTVLVTGATVTEVTDAGVVRDLSGSTGPPWVSVKLELPTEATVPASLASGMTTDLASTTLAPACVPVTSTTSPTTTLDRLGELTPLSLYLVDEETLTVTVVVVAVTVDASVLIGSTKLFSVSVKLEAPTEATVPASLASGMSTDVASSVAPLRAPVATTLSPTATSDRLGELTPLSSYFVDEETSTVTVVLAGTTVTAVVDDDLTRSLMGSTGLRTVRVKLAVPTEATVPATELPRRDGAATAVARAW
jgi:hypothetical protein